MLPRRRYRLPLLAGALLLLPAATALRPLGNSDAALLAAAEAEAARRIADVSIDRSQSFRVLRGNQFKGLLVAGAGRMARDGAGPIHGCFIVAVSADGRTRLLPTIGAGAWEAQTCGGLRAAGLVGGDALGRPRLALIYEASAYNSVAQEPVVLRWGGRLDSLEIDSAASTRAADAGAATIAETRAALAP